MREKGVPRFLVGTLLVLLLLAACVGGMVFSILLQPLWGGVNGARALQPPDGPPSEAVATTFAPFWEAWSLIETHYVDPAATDPQQLTYGAIRGMLDSLGDVGHTRFLTPEERRFHETSITGHFAGIGAEVAERDGQIVIVAPLEGSPAEQAGIRAGDVILQIDGQSTAEMDLSESVSLVRGEPGTEVTLTVLHADENEAVDITITRQNIELPAASWTLLPGQIAYIRMNGFSANLHASLEEILAEAQAAGVEGYLLDVRNNPGGLVTQVVAVTSEFLPEGIVFIERSRGGEQEVYRVQGGASVSETPIVVLINGGSASAAEIFAGALKDQGRAILVGEQTFGTGTVLNSFTLSDGSAVLLGVAEWLTPDGHLIKGNGVAPTIEVTLAPDTPPISPRQVEGLSLEELSELPDSQFLEGYRQLTGALEEGRGSD